MHAHHLDRWRHSHLYLDDSRAAERGTRRVLWITLAAMVVEITAGWWFNSMALLADGWHMSSHAVAIGLSAFAYAFARRHAQDRRYAFGTWKIEILGGFTSALLLGVVVLAMAVASLERLYSPQPIHYREAIAVAVLGLIVNLVCAWLLHRAGAGHGHHGHGHHGHDHHGHDHAPHAAQGHGHSHEHRDLNLRAAYVHVIADAATSVLAIAALVGGSLLGWNWLDPIMGLVGAALVARWAIGLLRESGAVLLDREMDHPVVEEIRESVEQALADSHTRIVDLHVWRVGRQAYACAISVVTHSPTLDADAVRATFAMHEEVRHATVEIHRCSEPGMS